jgi:hypothetical protein
MSLLLSSFTGKIIYLDTMLPYALLRGVDPAAEVFFARIENSYGKTRVQEAYGKLFSLRLRLE